jgi:hypothetical protein
MIQDEVQSHHWSCQQATLYNVILMWKNVKQPFYRNMPF